MSSSDQPVANVHVPLATTTPAPTFTNQIQGFSNSWSTVPNNKVFVFNAVATTAQTSSNATQGPSFSVFGDPGITNQQKLFSSLKSNNSHRFPQNAPEEEETTTEVRTTRKREYPLPAAACLPYSRPATPRQTFAQNLQTPSFGRDQSQTTNPFSWEAPSDTNVNTSWFSGNAPFNVNNKGEPVSSQSVPSNLHRTSSHGQRSSCQCHPSSHNDSDEMGMDCEYCEIPRSKSPKHVQFGFPSSLPQNNSGSSPCHTSFNNRCQQHVQNNSAMVEQEAMDTDTIAQSSSRSHLPSTSCNPNNCANCAVPGSCNYTLPPCQLPCGCPSRLAHHLRPSMQSQIKKKVLFIEEINLDGHVGPMSKSCSHFNRGCASPNDSPPVCMHGNSMSSLQHQAGFRNLPPDDCHIREPTHDCRPCGNRASAFNNSFLEGQSRTPRGILKAQSMRRHSTVVLPCQQDCSEHAPSSRCRYSMEKRTPECQSANSAFSREATFGYKRSVNFDPRFPAEDHTKSSNVDSFDSSSTGDQDVIFLKRQRTENR